MPTKKSTDSHGSEDGNDMARLLESEVATQTIDLSSLLNRDITSSGSFDIRGQIWSTTFGKLLQALPIPALLIDQSYAIAVANQACARVTRTYEKLHGHAFPSLFPKPLTSATIKGLLEEIFLQRRTKVTEALMQIQNKTTWTRITLRPIRIMDRRFILAILEDLNPEKRQIALQMKHEKELQKAHDKLKASLREKEILLREIHHRVKNNLQIMLSLLHLQSFHLENKSTEGVLEDLESRIRAIATVHEKLYQSENLMKIDFREYLQDLAEHLFHSYGPSTGGIELIIDIKDISCGTDTAVSLGLIVSELVSNSFKHAFPDGRTGSIVISLKWILGDEFELTVSDTGVGMPRDLSEMGSETLGLSLVKSLADQVHAEIRLDRTKGTNYRFRFREVEQL
jgi:two-component sensor histidine kinase